MTDFPTPGEPGGLPDQWGQQLINAITERLGGAGAIVRNTTTTWDGTNPSPNNAEHVMVLNDVVHDPSGFWNSATPSRLTVPAGLGGIYVIVGFVGFVYASSGGRSAQWWLNGTKITELGTIGSTVPIPDIAMLVPGDYVELGFYQSSGSPLAFQGASGTPPKLAIVRLGS